MRRAAWSAWASATPRPSVAALARAARGRRPSGARPAAVHQQRGAPLAGCRARARSRSGGDADLVVLDETPGALATSWRAAAGTCGTASASSAARSRQDLTETRRGAEARLHRSHRRRGGEDPRRDDPEALRETSPAAETRASWSSPPRRSSRTRAGATRRSSRSSASRTSASLRFESRADCEREDWLEAHLREATGVFLTGGNQLRLSTTLGGTPVTQLLRERNARRPARRGHLGGRRLHGRAHDRVGRSGAHTPRRHGAALPRPGPHQSDPRRPALPSAGPARPAAGRPVVQPALDRHRARRGHGGVPRAGRRPGGRGDRAPSRSSTPSSLEYSSMDTADENGPVSVIGMRMHVLVRGRHVRLATRHAQAAEQVEAGRARPRRTMSDEDPADLRLPRAEPLRALPRHPPARRPGRAGGLAHAPPRRPLHRRPGRRPARPRRPRLLLRGARRLHPPHARGRRHLARSRARARGDRDPEHGGRGRHLRQDARCRTTRRLRRRLRVRAGGGRPRGRRPGAQAPPLAPARRRCDPKTIVPPDFDWPDERDEFIRFAQRRALGP